MKLTKEYSENYKENNNSLILEVEAQKEIKVVLKPIYKWSKVKILPKV
jgi:hypothetical protein